MTFLNYKIQLNELIDSTIDVLKALGFNQTSLIGRGAEGVVFDVGKYAIKLQEFTKNVAVVDRYRFYSYLKGKKFKHIVNIHKVGIFGGYYYVLMDKVDVLGDEERMALEDAIEYHWYKFQNTKKYSFADPVHIFSGAVILPNENVEEIKAEYIETLKNSKDNKAYELFMDILKICDELKKHKIKWADPNPRNFGIRNGHLVAIDLDDDFETVDKKDKRLDI